MCSCSTYIYIYVHIHKYIDVYVHPYIYTYDLCRWIFRTSSLWILNVVQGVIYSHDLHGFSIHINLWFSRTPKHTVNTYAYWQQQLFLQTACRFSTNTNLLLQRCKWGLETQKHKEIQLLGISNPFMNKYYWLIYPIDIKRANYIDLAIVPSWGGEGEGEYLYIYIYTYIYIYIYYLWLNMYIWWLYITITCYTIL